MKGIRHPFTQALYEQDGQGNVRIAETDGRVGVYGTDGRWRSGDKVDVDFQLLGWVGGPRVQHHRLAVDER